LRHFSPTRRLRNLILAATVGILFALSDEYHQTFVPGRGGTLRDVGIDGLGVALACTLAWLRRDPRSWSSPASDRL
jgi:VanZ family protein